jgi:branched-chain amino acid aminotransferase
MDRSNYCYFNGDLVRYGDLRLHISDLLFQRGYGIFDFFRARNGTIPWFEDYQDRIFNSISLSCIEAEVERAQFSAIIHDLLEKNGMANGAFKVIITGGYSETLESVTGPANMIILNVSWKRPSEETFGKGVALIRKKYLRPNPEIKTLNYFNTLMLRNKIKEYGAVDVMFHTDRISEASRANLFFVRGGTIYTPASDILKGITRKQVLVMFPEIRVEEIAADNLYDFDEVFLTSTSRDITPVVSVEGRKIGKGTPGPVTKDIQAAFRNAGW